MFQKLNIILKIVICDFFNCVFESHPIQSPEIRFLVGFDRTRSWRIIQQR